VPESPQIVPEQAPSGGPRARSVTIMSAKVSTLLNVDVGHGRYVFLLITWNDYMNKVRDELNTQADAFAMDLGPSGVFVSAYPQRMYEVADEVLEKPWPESFAERLREDQDPIILVLERSWEDFDPREHTFAVVWLSEFFDDPSRLRPLLQRLARLSREGDDVIAYLRGVAERQERDRAVDTGKKGARAVARIGKYVRIEPTLFGVALDVDAILSDIASSKGWLPCVLDACSGARRLDRHLPGDRRLKGALTARAPAGTSRRGRRQSIGASRTRDRAYGLTPSRDLDRSCGFVMLGTMVPSARGSRDDGSDAGAVVRVGV
jgi:hypothetical protein